MNGTLPLPPMGLSNELLTTGVNTKLGGITKGSQSIAAKCLLGIAMLHWVLTFWLQEDGSTLISIAKQKTAITQG